MRIGRSTAARFTFQPGWRWSVGLSGIGYAFAAVLTLRRVRRLLLQQLLGAMTAGAFVALVFLSRSESESAGDFLLTAAAISAVFYFIVALFQGHFAPDEEAVIAAR